MSAAETHRAAPLHPLPGRPNAPVRDVVAPRGGARTVRPPDPVLAAGRIRDGGPESHARSGPDCRAPHRTRSTHRGLSATAPVRTGDTGVEAPFVIMRPSRHHLH